MAEDAGKSRGDPHMQVVDASSAPVTALSLCSNSLTRASCLLHLVVLPSLNLHINKAFARSLP